MRYIVFSACLLFQIGLARAEIRLVPQSYPTITSAIDESLPGDTVLVSPGLYSEQVNIVNRTLTLASYYLTSGDTMFRDQTKLTLPDSLRVPTNDNRSVIRIQNHSDVRISGFTVRSGLGTRYLATRRQYGGGIFADSSRLAMDWCQITQCESEYGGGVASYRSNCILESCRIDSCFGNSGVGGGAYLYLGDSIRVLNTIFANNAQSLGGGMGGRSVVYGEIVNSLFHANTASSQAGAAFLMGFHIERSIIAENKGYDLGGLLLQGNRRDEMYRFYSNQVLDNEADRLGAGPSVAGGVYFDMLSDPDSAGYIVRDSKFERNYSRTSGGAASIQTGRHYFSNNRFENNSANASSALEVRYNAIAYFDSNQVLNNNSGWSAIRVYNGGSVRATNCEFTGNPRLALRIEGLSENLVSAINCWWGNPSGPSCAENPGGMGDSVGTGIPFTPWRSTPVFNTAISSPAFTNVPINQRHITIFPNPSNGAVTIRLSMPHPSHDAALQIWDRMGRKVTELHRGSLAGNITEWKYHNDRLASGKYFIVLESADTPGPYLVPFTLIK